MTHPRVANVVDLGLRWRGDRMPPDILVEARSGGSFRASESFPEGVDG